MIICQCGFDTSGGFDCRAIIIHLFDFSRDRFGFVTDKLINYLHLSDHSLNSSSYFYSF